MKITSLNLDTQLLVVVEEDSIDAARAVQFKDRMRELSKNPASRIILDLSRVEFLDSSGLGAVVASMKQLTGDKRMDLVGPSPSVGKVFQITGLDTVFRTIPSRDAALRDQTLVS